MIGAPIDCDVCVCVCVPQPQPQTYAAEVFTFVR